LATRHLKVRSPCGMAYGAPGDGRLARSLRVA
jgi:hypothetical protein